MVLTDNFGKMFATVFRPVSGANGNSFLVTAENGLTQTCFVYAHRNQTQRYDYLEPRSQCQIGNGTTTPTRQDFETESPFLTSPESQLNVNGIGGYDSGLAKVQIPCIISPTGDSGAIGEACYFVKWRNSGGGVIVVMLTRDLVIPIQNFIAGKTINVALEVLI